jgi:hypothetical protein
VVVSLLNAVQDNHALLGSLPGALQTVILIVAPTTATVLAGYAARHTPRSPDGPWRRVLLVSGRTNRAPSSPPGGEGALSSFGLHGRDLLSQNRAVDTEWVGIAGVA